MTSELIKRQMERQAKYTKKQIEREMTQMRIWVPKKYRAEMLSFAEDLRRIYALEAQRQ